MIEINIGALVVLLGIPTAVTGFCFWMLEHRIQKREKQKEAEEAKRQKEAAARERAREDLQIITIQARRSHRPRRGDGPGRAAHP